MKVASVILAAGASTRMGVNKLLLRVEGKYVIEWILDTVTRVSVQTIVVLGHNPRELVPLISSYDVNMVINENYSAGMTSSFKKGVLEVSEEAAFLVLGDQLGVETDLMKLMIHKMEGDEDVLVVSPIFDGGKGHPVLFRDKLFPKILALDNRETLRDLINSYEDNHYTVQGNQLYVMDFDTPEEFKEVVGLWRSTRF